LTFQEAEDFFLRLFFCHGSVEAGRDPWVIVLDHPELVDTTPGQTGIPPDSLGSMSWLGEENFLRLGPRIFEGKALHRP
jgi:hypothetical protein